MYKSFLNRNLFLFVLITALSIGGIIVYAMNNMDDSNTKESTSALGNKTQATQRTNQADDQTIQNFDINKQTPQQVEEATPQPTQSVSTPTPSPISQVKELQVSDVVVGSGVEVENGDTVEVNYLGTFLNGQKFDSSYDRNQTFSFTVGEGKVIKGWDLGLIGMKAGGKRILLIPSDLAYGTTGAPGSIPPNTPLKFEIELVNIN